MITMKLVKEVMKMMNNRAEIEWDKLISGAIAIAVLIIVILGVVIWISRNVSIPADIAKCENNLGGKCYAEKQPDMYCINGSCSGNTSFCCRTI
jgi:hypothetical protein